jgi:Protein of unknown function (DUF3237)
MTDTLDAPPMTLVFTIDVSVGAPVVLSESPVGRRVFIPIVGGTVRGTRLRGEVLTGGGDWAVERANGVMDIHAHYLIRSDDGVVIEVDNRGHWRDVPSGQPYFVTAPVFFVDSDRYGWLTQHVFIGMMHEVDETRITIDVFAVERPGNVGGMDVDT